MAKFVQINTTSECCQSFGICGDQFALDVIFDDTGIVSTTRFRFMHKLQKSQGDLIKGLVQTRNACDLYSKNLTTYEDAEGDDSDNDAM